MIVNPGKCRDFLRQGDLYHFGFTNRQTKSRPGSCLPFGAIHGTSFLSGTLSKKIYGENAML